MTDRTFTLSKRSRTVRFYTWLWMADAEKINVCKLFWGYLLAPLGFVLRFLIRKLASDVEKKQKMDATQKQAADKGDKTAGFIQRHRKLVRGVGAVVTVAVLAGVVALCVLFPWDMLKLVLVLGSVLLIATVLIFVGVQIEEHKEAKPLRAIGEFFSLMWLGAKSVKRRTCPVIEVHE